MLKAYHMNDIDEIWIGRNEEEVRAAYEADCDYMLGDEFYEVSGADLDMEIINPDEGTTSTLRQEIEEAEKDYSGPFSVCCDAAYA